MFPPHTNARTFTVNRRLIRTKWKTFAGLNGKIGKLQWSRRENTYDFAHGLNSTNTRLTMCVGSLEFQVSGGGSSLVACV